MTNDLINFQIVGKFLKRKKKMVGCNRQTYSSISCYRHQFASVFARVSSGYFHPLPGDIKNTTVAKLNGEGGICFSGGNLRCEERVEGEVTFFKNTRNLIQTGGKMGNWSFVCAYAFKKN